jgi:hypothetical protein
VKVLLVAAACLVALPLLLAQPADARQACVWDGTDPCDDHLVCVYDRVAGQWRCFVGIECPLGNLYGCGGDPR